MIYVFTYRSLQSSKRLMHDIERRYKMQLISSVRQYENLHYLEKYSFPKKDANPTFIY